MGNIENLRAALIAAASMYPDGYGALKQLGTITATQHVQMVFDRAEEMAAWLDAKENEQPATARAVIRDVQHTRRGDKSPVIFSSREESIAYAKWLDANNLRDNPSNQRRYLEEQTRGGVVAKTPGPPHPEAPHAVGQQQTDSCTSTGA